MAAARQASVRGLHCSASSLLHNCPSSLQAESTAYKFSYICLQSSKCRAHTSKLANRSSPFFGTSVESSTVSRKQRKKVRRTSNLFKAALAEAPETATAPPAEIAVHKRKSGSVALVALGCPKNTVDAEVMLGDLQRQGYQIIDDPESADVVIVNTCAFIEDAKRESIDAITAAGELKGKSAKGVLVTGCLAQRYSKELGSELPFVDAVMGFESYSQLSSQVDRILNNGTASISAIALEQNVMVGTPHVPFRIESERRRITAQHTAYLRVAEGCDHTCTFCSIPGFRGKFRSKKFEAIVAEANLLAASGAREICLIAEDTNQWGSDFGDSDPRRLQDLLRAIADNPRVKWIRLLYCYPSYFTEELISAIASIDKVCKYIDIPLQHMSSSVLQRMQRPSKKHAETLLRKLKERIPGLVLRTTFISGFPGETEDEHEELMGAVKEFGFERGGVFSYSREDGTPAADLDKQVGRRTRERRQCELQDMMRDRQMDWAGQQIGRTLDVMVDAMEGPVAVGRTQYDAPEIDNHVRIDNCLIPFTPGSVLRCKVVGSEDWDLIAEPIEVT